MMSSARLAWAMLTMILLATAGLRFRLLDVPLERDEGEYAYFAQLVLQGIAPYAEAYNFKMPGTYFAYALILAAFGQTPRAVHLGFLITNGATIVLLFALARRLFDPMVGLAAGAFFAALSLSPGVLGSSAHAEHFVLLPAIAGVLVLLAAPKIDHGLACFASGFLFGLGFLMKQSGAAFVAFGVLYILLPGAPLHAALTRRVRAAVTLLFGALMPFTAVCVGLLIAGSFRPFWFWAFTYGVWYASATSLREGLVNLAESLAAIVPACLTVLGLAVLGLIAISTDPDGRVRRRFVAFFTLASLVGVSFGLYFRRHYFVLLLPAVALLAGVGAVGLARTLATHHPRTAWAFALALTLGACVHGVYVERTLLFYLPPVDVSRTMYQGNPFSEAVEIGKYIRERTSGEDRIVVFGSEPQIYFYAGRRAATGYIHMYALMEPQPFAGRMQREMIEEIQAGHPRYLVVVNVHSSWLTRANSDRTIFRWIDEYSRQGFHRVGVVDMPWLGETRYYWGEQAATHAPQSTVWVMVLERDETTRPTAR